MTDKTINHFMFLKFSEAYWALPAEQRGAFFPSAIRLHPLFRSGDRGYGLLDWQNAQNASRIVAMSFCEPRSCRLQLSS